MTRKWRPSLALVLGGALLATLAMSLIGLVVFRYLGPAIGFRTAAVLIGATLAVLTGGLGWLLVRLLLRPIRELEAFATARETGAEAQPMVHFGTRELHQTAQRVVAMASTLADREATIRAYTDHVTHELKTPVSAIRAASEMLQDALEDADTARLFSQLDGARVQLESQLEALRRAARARETRFMGQTRLADVLPNLAAQFPSLRLDVVSGAAEPLPMAIEGVTLLLGHMLRNAAESGATEVCLKASASQTAYHLTVSDNGPGVSKGNADRIFDPFFTSRKESGGTGMGLTIVRNVLAAHGGEIALLPGPGGAVFKLTFRRRP